MTYRDATFFYDAIQERFELSDDREFEVADHHIALARHANMTWHADGSSGGPGLDRKRPYGNSDWHEDVAEMVEGAFLNAMGPGARQDYIEANAERWERLHAETAIAIQVILHTGQFEPGLYRDDLKDGWTKIA